MRNVIFILILLLITTACDQGRIYDHEPDFSRPGMVARVSVATSGSPAWPQGYTLAVAGFENGNDYALISKNVSPEPDGNCSVVLAGIPASASTVELCVIDRLRRRIASFASVEADPMADTIRIDAQGIDISVSNFIQTSIFNTTCI
ncbi:MAG: hypothetical protein K2F79_09290, partial [Muribaculaceae bacterium]|nr:hypothetical protein [Muribaculaceae bacterium]